MSGLSEIGGLPGFAGGGQQVQPADIDEYKQYFIFSPSVDTSWIGTVTSSTANAAVVFKNAYPDVPRNVSYSVTGGASGQGGTFNLVGKDQFGSVVKETVVIGSANGGGTTQGTQIFGAYTSGTYSPNGAAGSSGTAAIGFGTASGITGNWFGLPHKIAGTADVKNILWVTTNTPTTLNGGTAIGTLVSAVGGTRPQHAFQGTSGVAITDRYLVTYKPSFDNAGKGTMALTQ